MLDMAEGQFSNSLFGFKKQDVADYIENSAKRLNILKNEKDKLDTRCAEMEKELSARVAELKTVKTENASYAEKIAVLEEQLSASEAKSQSLESELEALKSRLSGYEEKAAIYDAAKDRIAGLELSASKRAVDIERAAERRAAEISESCEAYIASIKAEYTKVSNDTRESSESIIAELNRLSERLAAISALLGEKAEAFNNTDNKSKEYQIIA